MSRRSLARARKAAADQHSTAGRRRRAECQRERHLGAASTLPVDAGWGSVSADGSRVFWTSSHLYMRDFAKGETLRIGDGSFQAASRDGSRVFFDEAGDLRLCEIFEESGKDACSSPI